LQHSSWLFCCVPENVIGLERRGSSLTHSERASTQRKPCLNGTSVHTTAAIPDAIDSAHVTGSAEVSTLSSCAHCKQRRHACAVAATPQPAAPTHRTLCRVLFHMCKNLSPKALHHPHASTCSDCAHKPLCRFAPLTEILVAHPAAGLLCPSGFT